MINHSIIYSVFGIKKHTYAIEYWANLPEFDEGLKEFTRGGRKVSREEILGLMESINNRKYYYNDPDFDFDTAKRGIAKVRRAMRENDDGGNAEA